MTYIPLKFTPGINRDITPHANEGGWIDCDNIRFRQGFPETIGGWEKVAPTTFLGSCRALHSWVALDNSQYLGIGTHLKYYILEGQDYYDITPIRATTAAGDVTFAATGGSTVLTVTDAGHAAAIGDYVTFSGAVSLGGVVTAGVLNAEHQIASISSGNVYTITLAAAANASDMGNGGASVVGAYQINTGLDSVSFGNGWGAGVWEADATNPRSSTRGWNGSADTTLAGSQLRTWSHDNYGEDLLFCPRNGGVYYWDKSTALTARAVALSSVSGANLAPTIARIVMTSSSDRHAIAFACDDEDSIGTQDPLLIRFSDQENIAEWETRADTTAGSLRVGSGSEIITAVRTRQQILIITDISAHVMQYLGAPYTFGITEISTGVTALSPNCAVSAKDSVYWMGDGDFHMYNGTVQQIPCPLLEHVFDDFNRDQKGKVACGDNSEHSEIWWFYPSADSDSNNRYVIYNYQENIWYYGSMGRTAWEQAGVFGDSIAAGTDNYLYYHEVGINDGSENPPVGISSFIESSPVDMESGDRYLFADRVIPDVTFRSSVGTPTATLTIKAQDWPGGGYVTKEEDGAVTRSASVPVEKYTKEQYIRLRGRAMALRFESDEYNTSWRLGIPRINVRPDGRG